MNAYGECHAPCTLKINKYISNHSRYKRLNVSSLLNSVTVKFWCPVCPVPPSFLNILDTIELMLVLSKREQVAAER